MKLYIAGTRLVGAGYPNAQRTIQLLREMGKLNICDCGHSLPEDTRLWALAAGRKSELTRFLARIFLFNLASFIKIYFRYSASPGPVYVPYPAIFFLLLISILPPRLRPYCIADAYISIWDSMFNDRATKDARPGYLSRIIRWLEARALAAASVVLVDTDANKEMMIKCFGLDETKVFSIPLAIDESIFCKQRSNITVKSSDTLTVLFVGTLIPLHGIPTIIEALKLLSSDERLSIRFVGHGQLAYSIENFVREQSPRRFEWRKDWCPPEELAQEIAKADICLGIFGGDQKAARVLPFKIYMYFACGRATISQSLLSLPDDTPSPPILSVAPGSPSELARAVLQLADEPELRARIAAQSATYFDQWLSNHRVLEVWIEQILPRFTGRQAPASTT